MSIKQYVSEISAFKNALWLTLALLATIAIYVFCFTAQGGRDSISPDGVQYLALARGESTNAPYNARVLKPRVAMLFSAMLGLSHQSAFQILTPIELFLSLILLARLVRDRGGSTALQCVIVLTFGYGMSVVFGRTPVLVDTLLLLLTCLFLSALEADRFAIALACTCLAVLTKEYGVLLAMVLAVEALRRRRVVFAVLGSAFPLALYFVNKQMVGGTGSGDLLSLLAGAAKYTADVLTGANGYKAAYFWLWAAIWPLMLTALISVIAHLARNRKIASQHRAFVATLVFVPFLLTGDWDRSLMIVVPFACMTATSHPLATDRVFLLFVMAGGLATALARPAITPIPPGLKITLMAISLLSTLVLMLKVAGSCFRQTKIPAVFHSRGQRFV